MSQGNVPPQTKEPEKGSNQWMRERFVSWMQENWQKANYILRATGGVSYRETKLGRVTIRGEIPDSFRFHHPSTPYLDDFVDPIYVGLESKEWQREFQGPVCAEWVIARRPNSSLGYDIAYEDSISPTSSSSAVQSIYFRLDEVLEELAKDK